MRLNAQTGAGLQHAAAAAAKLPPADITQLPWQPVVICSQTRWSAVGTESRIPDTERRGGYTQQTGTAPPG